MAFICNHCPYVKHLDQGPIDFARDYEPKGIATIAISSNDIDTHPEDRPEMMRIVAQDLGYPFPYLYDESQKVAKAFRASCTPDFFLFNGARRLVYRGQFDESRPGNNLPVTGQSLHQAADALLMDQEVPSEQRPSMGCNIKWRAGNDPEYFAKA